MSDLPQRVKSTLGWPHIEYDLTWRRGDDFRFAVVDGYAVCQADDGATTWTRLISKNLRFRGIAVEHAGLLNAFATLGWEVIG